MINSLKKQLHSKLILKFSGVNRLGIAKTYIRGEGIEIGALDYPLKVPKNVRVKYLDRISREEHAKMSNAFKLKRMVRVDIIGDGETLKEVADQSQDFVIANHFIEHCQNPIMTISNMIRVTKSGGVIFLCIPDKRCTFDINRDETPIEHLVKDYEQGPQWSEQGHYEDFVMKTIWGEKVKTDKDLQDVVDHLKAINWSIHFHVWSHPAMVDFFQYLKNEMHFPFTIEFTAAPVNGSNEGVFVLRKKS
jgi:predicted SAM-dependent methyltransferase